MLLATRPAVQRADRGAGAAGPDVRGHQLAARRRPAAGLAARHVLLQDLAGLLRVGQAYSRPLSSAAVNRLTISGFSLAILVEVISTLP